jgi:hypothetical protein
MLLDYFGLQALALQPPPPKGRSNPYTRLRSVPEDAPQAYNLDSLIQQDQEVVELLLGLVTKGFFYGNPQTKV